MTTRVTWLAREERLRDGVPRPPEPRGAPYGRGVGRQDQEASSEADEGIRYGRQVGVTATLAFEADKAGRIEPAGETLPSLSPWKSHRQAALSNLRDRTAPRLEHRWITPCTPCYGRIKRSCFSCSFAGRS